MHHHISGRYLGAYASERAWREDNRRVSNGELYLMVSDAALKYPVSRQWKGYWRRTEQLSYPPICLSAPDASRSTIIGADAPMYAAANHVDAQAQPATCRRRKRQTKPL